MSDMYEIKDDNFNYYHYQPGSNIIIVYCKHITHARMCAHARTRVREHTHTHTHTYSLLYRLALFVGAQPRRPALLSFMAASRVIQINTRAGDPIFTEVLDVFHV